MRQSVRTATAPAAAQQQLKAKQGRTPYLVEMKIVDDEGNDLPRDGEAYGHLVVRGPAVAGAHARSRRLGTGA